MRLPFQACFHSGCVFTTSPPEISWPTGSQGLKRAAAAPAPTTSEPRAAPAPEAAPVRKLRRAGSVSATLARTEARTRKKTITARSSNEPTASTTPATVTPSPGIKAFPMAWKNGPAGKPLGSRPMKAL